MAQRPTKEYLDEIEIKKSRFIGIGHPITSVDDCREILKRIKFEYPDSRHVCYGFLWGEDCSHMGMSDDGEPSGTAGRPILEVLKGSGIENILVAVVRYFGGTKLGTGGLVKAYTQITKNIIEGIQLEEYVERREIEITIPYTLYNQIKKIIEKYGYIIIDENFGTEISIKFSSILISENEFNNDLMNLSNGSLSLSKS